MVNNDWHIYKGSDEPHKDIGKLPDAPTWRQKDIEEYKKFKPMQEEKDLVNAALYLRRPILITGNPGVGKSTLAKAVAYELGLGDVLPWYITTQSTLKDALYSYDAVARLHDTSLNKTIFSTPKEEELGKYITLGALGTAFKSKKIRVVLIDEIDKSDVDLPNNLLHVFEENEFTIPELVRSHISPYQVNTLDEQKVSIVKGKIEVNPNNFPLIIMTSNGEREFPPAFMRRCLHMTMQPRRELDELKNIIRRHNVGLNEQEMALLNELLDEESNLVTEFLEKDKTQYNAIDQLLNSIFLKLKGVKLEENEKLLNAIWKALAV